MCEVSVIVPVYNSDKWIRRCVDSILKQSFIDWELILVNDGSTDNSGKICEEYSRKYNNIFTVHQNNGGVSSARNAGLDRCRGKYIMFCDADDSVKENWIETLVSQMRISTNSFINCEYEKIDNLKGTRQRVKIDGFDKVTKLSKDEYFLLEKSGFAPYLWNKIYRHDIIADNKIRFDQSLKISEDVFFNITYFKLCNDIIHIPVVCYEYIDNGESVSRAYDAHYFQLLKMLYMARRELICKKYLQEFYNTYFYRFYQCLDIVMDDRNLESYRNKIQHCNHILNDSCFLETLRYVDNMLCDSKTKYILKYRNYILLCLFKKLVNLKNKIIKN